jgi:hypothetical protein
MYPLLSERLDQDRLLSRGIAHVRRNPRESILRFHEPTGGVVRITTCWPLGLLIAVSSPARLWP